MNTKLAGTLLFTLVICFPSLSQKVTIDQKLNFSYNPKKKWIPGEEDKGGYWYKKDYGALEAMDIYPQKNLLAAVTRDRSKRVYRLFLINYLNGKVVKQKVITENRNAQIKCVKISPNGKFVAVAEGGDKAFSIWDATTGMHLGRAKTEARAASLAWHPNGTKIAVACKGQVELWKVTQPAAREKFIRGARASDFGWTTAVAWSPDGNYLAIGTNEPAVYISNMTKGAQSSTLQPKPKGSVHQLEWNAGGTMLAARGFGFKSTLVVWKDPKNAVDHPFDKDYQHLVTFDPQSYTGTWTKMGWSPKGTVLALADNEKTLYFFNAKNGKLLRQATPFVAQATSDLVWNKSDLILSGPNKDYQTLLKHWQISLIHNSDVATEN